MLSNQGGFKESYVSRTALIDGDIILYRSCWACQKTHYTHKETGEFFDGKLKAKKWYKETYSADPDWDSWEIEEEVEPFKNVKFLLDHYVSEIMGEGKADQFKLYLSPSKCFRDDIAVTAPYKAGRPPPPHHKEAAKDYLIKRYNAVIGDNLEADDMMGLAQTTDTFIASIDKDLYMIPGKHYDIVTKEKRMIDIQSADDWFFTQLIAGDRTDNIKGLPKYGIKTATTIVNDFAGDHVSLVEEIEELYKENYPNGREVMIEHAQLVYILRPGDTPGKEQWRRLLLLDD